MSDTLREAIKHASYPDGIWVQISTNKLRPDDSKIDAILDAVIASIPQASIELDEPYDRGYNWALAEVRSILSDAKEIK